LQNQPTYTQLLDATRLHAAWLRVAKRGKKGGVDDKQIADLLPKADKWLAELLTELENKTYVPEPYLAVSIPKYKTNNEETTHTNQTQNTSPNTRQLGLLTIRDKVVQQAITDLLLFYFDRKFYDSSFAYRPKRSVPQAVERVAYNITDVQWVSAPVATPIAPPAERQGTINQYLQMGASLRCKSVF
jgi:RNA-directed DNA polymerase